MLVIKEKQSGFDIFTKVFYSGLYKIKYDTEYVKYLFKWLLEKGKWDEFEDILRDVFPNGTNLDEYHSYLIDHYKDIGAKMGFTN